MSLFGSARNGEEEYPIYKNPSPEELQKIKTYSIDNDVDFISVVGLNGDVYFSPATMLHAAVVRTIKEYDPNENFGKNFVALSGYIEDGKVSNYFVHPEKEKNEAYDQQYNDIKDFDYFKDAAGNELGSTGGNMLEEVEKYDKPNPLDEMNLQMLEKPNIHGDAKGVDAVKNNDYSEAMKKLLWRK